MLLYVNAADCSTWTDLSGTGNTITFRNASALVSTPASSEAMVVSPCAMSFNGTQEVTTSTAVAAPTTFSLGVWFTTTTASGRKLVGLESAQTGTGSTAYDHQMWVGTNGQLYFTGWSSGTTVGSSVFVADGLPHYAVGTFDPSTSAIKLYLDGVQVASGTITGSMQTGCFEGFWRIGGYKILSYTNASTDGYVTARLYAVQVYSIALTATQVASNYAALFSSGTLAPGAVLCPAGK